MVVLPVVATIVISLWASCNSLATCLKYVNDTRNTIIVGEINRKLLDKKTRRMILLNDWIPVWGFMEMLALVFSMILIVLPFAADLKTAWNQLGVLWIVCFAVGVVHIIFFIGGIWTGIQDIYEMRDALRNCKEPSTLEEKIDQRVEKAIAEKALGEFFKKALLELMKSKPD